MELLSIDAVHEITKEHLAKSPRIPIKKKIKTATAISNFQLCTNFFFYNEIQFE